MVSTRTTDATTRRTTRTSSSRATHPQASSSTAPPRRSDRWRRRRRPSLRKHPSRPSTVRSASSFAAPAARYRVGRRILDEPRRTGREVLSDDGSVPTGRQMLSASAFMPDTITGRAFRFGQLLATGAASSLAEWYDRLAAVTAEEIRAAADATFQEKSRVVGWFVPEAS